MTLESFLQFLGQPSFILLPGEDKERTRAVCTLLHGNEPSGIKAIHKFLRTGTKPKVNTLFIIGSIPAALHPPLFSHRTMPGQRDLNRCFSPPFEDEAGAIAHDILTELHRLKPECLIDIHNTSGCGPAFGVAIYEDQNHCALTSLFTNDLIVTDLRLGALMELSELDVPTVTIECGGAREISSDLIAQEGLNRYLLSEHVLATPNINYQVNTFRNPIRLELINAAKAAYHHEQKLDADITLAMDAERLNYGTITPDTQIGILGPKGLDALTAKDHHGHEQLNHYFEEKQGILHARSPLKLFMVTINEVIAESDCLFYFIACD